MKNRTLSIVTTGLAVALLFASNLASATCPSPPKLFIGDHKLELTLDVPCAAPDGNFYIIVEPDAGVLIPTIEVKEKDSAGPNVRGGNVDVPEIIAIKVAPSATPGTELHYFISVDGIGKLDPRVRVIPSIMLLNPELAQVGRFLKENYFFDLDTIAKIDDDLKAELGLSLSDVLEMMSRASADD